MNQKLRPVILVAIGGLCLSLLSFFVWMGNAKTNDRLYFGVVRNLAGDTFIIDDRFSGGISVDLSDTTQIFRGDVLIQRSEIVQGDFVQIAGTLKDGRVSAETMRIMKAPRQRGKESAP